MDLLLDTHVLVGFINETLGKRLRDELDREDHELHVSVASLWEIAIKVRLGKLDLDVPLEDLPAFIDASRMNLLAIGAPHALAEVHPAPATRDPFDRLLLAQCTVEKMQLVTLDRALAAHPLAMRV